MTDQNDPNAPLEDVQPVPATPVSGEGEQPPADWGENGEGNDAEDVSMPQEAQRGD